MNFQKLFLSISFLLSVKFNEIPSLQIPVPFARDSPRLPDGATETRDRSRYRHNFAINPIIRTAGNNQTFPPVIWDLAPQSYPIDFFLYTKDTPYLAEGLTVNNASESKYFDKGKPTKVLIHDFMQSTENPLIYDLKDAYMNKKQDFNVILVDWEPARTYTYTVAVTVSEYVGKMTARLIQVMKIDPSKIHVIGFGLGAHAAGVMGNDMKIRYNTTLSRITGLDPSLPLFRMAGNYFKLDPEDAAFVDVIHTDGGDNLWNSNHLGMGKELGHVDIYPNRGIFQPGCRQSSLPSYDTLMCSHTRALEIYKESIEDELSFVACRCPTWTDFMENKCDCMKDSNRVFVGEACSPFAPKGNYYLVTHEAPPYGLGGKGVVPTLTRAADPGNVMQTLFNPVNGSFLQGITQLTHVFTSPFRPLLNTLVRNAQTINAAAGESNHLNDPANRQPPPNALSNLLNSLTNRNNNNNLRNLFNFNNQNQNDNQNDIRNLFNLMNNQNQNNNQNNNQNVLRNIFNFNRNQNQNEQVNSNDNNSNFNSNVHNTNVRDANTNNHQFNPTHPPPPPPPPHFFHQDTLVYNEGPAGGGGMMDFNPSPSVPSQQFRIPPPQLPLPMIPQY